MYKTSDGQGGASASGRLRIIPFLLWLSLFSGWLVSIFSVIEEMCLATACRDTASFTLFGAGMGWFGIAYFSLILLLLWLRQKVHLLNWGLSAMVFSGIGAEFRLLWIQKYIIGGWCPLCVTICCTLFLAAALLLVENMRDTSGLWENGKSLTMWLTFVTLMVAIGLAVALLGIKALV